MAHIHVHFFVLLCVCIAAVISAQSTTIATVSSASVAAQSTSIASESGYLGYTLTSDGDPDSVVYDTNSTTVGNASTSSVPDVYLSASVHVGEIDLTVTNLTAKINLEAQVLQLLSFNAGVSASIDQVQLLIQNVNAEVLLEARLGNLLLMISDVLSSLDLNPVLATLGSDLTNIVNTTVGALTGTTSTVQARSYNLVHNVLYSVNDYSGNTHTNRVLAQNGSIVDPSVNNDGFVYAETTVGYYLQDMTFNGYNKTLTGNSQADRELEYVYEPFAGLQVVSAIFMNAAGQVVGTQVLSEATGGGSSTVGDSQDL
jgi:hypothetical protein